MLLGQIRRAPDLRLSPAAASGRLDSDLVALFQPHTGLARQSFACAVLVHNFRSSCLTVSSALQAIWTAAATIGQQRNFGVGQQFHFAHDSITATELPASIEGVTLTCIGEIIPSAKDHQVLLVDGSTESVLHPRGWDHFKAK